MKNTTLKLSSMPLALLTAACLAPSASHAAALVFNDTNPNDLIEVRANDFEYGLNVNGSSFQDGLDNEAVMTVNEADGAITFSGTWITAYLQQPVSRTIYLVEACDPTLISDILTIHIQPIGSGSSSTINGSFISDFEDNLGHLPANVDPGDVFVEDGNPVRLGFAYFGIAVYSDASGPGDCVPETGGIAVMALAGLGLAGFARARR